MKYIDRLIDAILNYIKKFLSYKFYLIKMEVSYLIYKFFNKIIFIFSTVSLSWYSGAPI